MSYSRWINSQFYTYWCSSKVYDKQDELFACHATLDGQHMFTYTECKEFVKDPILLYKKITDIVLEEEDVKELIGYMKEFISDVDLEYSQHLDREKRLIELRGGQ